MQLDIFCILVYLWHPMIEQMALSTYPLLTQTILHGCAKFFAVFICKTVICNITLMHSTRTIQGSNSDHSIHFEDKSFSLSSAEHPFKVYSPFADWKISFMPSHIRQTSGRDVYFSAMAHWKEVFFLTCNSEASELIDWAYTDNNLHVSSQAEETMWHLKSSFNAQILHAHRTDNIVK